MAVTTTSPAELASQPPIACLTRFPVCRSSPEALHAYELTAVIDHSNRPYISYAHFVSSPVKVTLGSWLVGAK